MTHFIRILCGLLLLISGVAFAQLPGAPAIVRNFPLVAAPFTVIDGNQTIYVALAGSDLGSSVGYIAPTRFERSGVLRGLSATLTVAPGGSATVTVTLQTGVCGFALTDRAITVTFTGSDIVKDDLTHAVAVAQGDCAIWKVQLSAAAATTRFNAQLGLF